jgi:hypothetical protein
MSSFGFVGFEDLADERVVDGRVQMVNDAIRASLDEHNRQVNAALLELVERTTDYTVRYKIGGAGTLQPLDEWGNPLPVKDVGFYDVAFPIQGGGTAWGDNRVSRALMTVAEADRLTVGMLRRDADWMRRHILATLFDNTTWSFVDEEKGTLTVQPLANNDAVTYLRNNGTLATDNHYYAQAGAISDAANPFPTWLTELKEHPENGGPFVAYIPTNVKAAVQGLANFIDVADPNVNPGIMAPTLTNSTLSRGFGDEVVGYVDGVYVVEWSFLPDNYGIVVARGAETKPLRMREYPAASLQGLFVENFSPDGNLNEYRFIRYAGFGAYNRVGALSFRIGNGAYAIPTGYSTPLAV